MIDERKEETAALYALDLLEGAERSSFEAELKADPELQKLVAQLRDASAQLAYIAPPAFPSDALRTRVLASIAATPQETSKRTPPAAKTPAPVIAFPLFAWTGWAAAACFAIGLIYLSTRYFSVRTESASLRNDLELTRVETQTIQQRLEAVHILTSRQITDLQTEQKAAIAKIAVLQLEGDLAQLKITKLASLVGTPEAAAFAVWNPLKKEGVLTVEKLAALKADQDYQLWVFDPKKSDPVSCSVFSVDEKGTAHYQFRPDQQISAAAVFAVTLERKGGVPKPQGPIVLKGDL